MDGVRQSVRVFVLRAKFRRRVLRLAGLIVATCLALGCQALGVPAAAVASSPPSEVQTGPAKETLDGFMLTGELNPENSATSYYFIYKRLGEAECEDLEGCGLETAHGVLSGDGEQEVTPIEVSGLAPGTTYVYWLIAKNAGVAVRGRELTFATPIGAPPSEVVTESAEATVSGVRLNGRLNPNDLPTNYYFEYIGVNEVNCMEVENCRPQTVHMGPIGGGVQQPVPAIEVTGLKVGEAYLYWLVASNSDRTVRGNVANFTVSATGKPSEVRTEPVESTTNDFTTPPEGDHGRGEQGSRGESESMASPLLATPPMAMPRIVAGVQKPLTRWQELAKALKVCEREWKSARKRAACEKEVREKYGVTIEKKGRQASKR